jgi:Ni/Fe-hydrogenase subunit HybB-like protein
MEHLMHKITLPLVIFGVVLSTLHQSSLGSLFIIMQVRLFPLWWTPMLPVFFFTSAVATGLAMMMVVPCINAKAFSCDVKDSLLAGLAKPAAIVLSVYLALKLGDLYMRGQLYRVAVPGAMSALWWIEILFGIVIPIALLLTPQVRDNRKYRFYVGLMVIAGVALNRFNVTMFGFSEYLNSLNALYVPSFGEIMITLGLVAVAVTAYIVAVKVLPVLPKPQTQTQQEVVVEPVTIHS